MRIVYLFLFLSIALHGENWTVNGKDYHNVKVGQVEADRVHITYDGGVGTLPLADLSSLLQKKFNFDHANTHARELVREDTEMPDWQKISDSFLKDLVKQVQDETGSASTEIQKLHAKSDQNRLLFFHKVFSGNQLTDSQKTLLHKWASCTLQDEVCVGMPKDLIFWSWGYPDTDTTSTSGDGDDWETMTFGHWASIVFVRGGFVKNITQTQTAQN